MGKIIPLKSFKSRDLEEIHEIMGPEKLFWLGEWEKTLEEIIETPWGQKWAFFHKVWGPGAPRQKFGITYGQELDRIEN